MLRETWIFIDFHGGQEETRVWCGCHAEPQSHMLQKHGMLYVFECILFDAWKQQPYHEMLALPTTLRLNTSLAVIAMPHIIKVRVKAIPWLDQMSMSELAF